MLNNSRKKILICGDSYFVPDEQYPGLHWSEKLANLGNFELINMAHGGCSNALIVLQLLQGIELNPDFVIISFTNEGRYEVDKDLAAVPYELKGDSLAAYQKERYTTNKYNIDPLQNKIINQLVTEASSPNFEKLKNYFYICFCLEVLKSRNIKFCFSLGGFEYKNDYTALVNQSYINNQITNFLDNEIKINLWYYGSKASPSFHVSNDKIQTLFANECANRINIEDIKC